MKEESSHAEKLESLQVVDKLIEPLQGSVSPAHVQLIYLLLAPLIAIGDSGRNTNRPVIDKLTEPQMLVG